MSAADLDRSRALYAREAARYDRTTRIIDRVRADALATLDAKAGEIIVDVGCDTGVNLPQLASSVGHGGMVIGVEPSDEMLALARDRIGHFPGGTIRLLNATAADARLPASADAALFCFTHDVLRDPWALIAILGQLKPDARVVAAGGKWAPWWAMPVNAAMWLRARRYATTFESYGRPWTLLEPMLDEMRIAPSLLGAAYVMSGKRRPDGSRFSLETAPRAP